MLCTIQPKHYKINNKIELFGNFSFRTQTKFADFLVKITFSQPANQRFVGEKMPNFSLQTREATNRVAEQVQYVSVNLNSGIKYGK